MRRALFSIFVLSLILTLASCAGSANAPSEAFARQDSYSCQMSYTITFDAVIDGEGYSGLTQQLTADGLVSLTGRECCFSGTLNTTANEELLGTMIVKSYATDRGSYYRYDDVCYFTQQPNTFRSVTDAPETINLSDYTPGEHTETILGTTCTLWTGTEIADDTAQRFVSGMTQGEVSLEGCLARVTLWAGAQTGLPVRLEMDYSNIAELDITFYDDAGNRFTITSLMYCVDYTGYGIPVQFQLPKELESAPDADDILNANTDEPEVPSELISRGVISYTGDPNADLSLAYAILNDDSSACYIIDTPEFMELDEYQRDYLCFYFLYDDFDVEYISYTFYSHFTAEEEEEYALELPDYLAESEGISQVTDTGIQAITIDGREIRYNVVYYAMSEDGITYDCMEVYSWMEAPNGRDCLEVSIAEYNATGDEQFVDVEEELIYAYEAILGYGVMKE